MLVVALLLSFGFALSELAAQSQPATPVSAADLDRLVKYMQDTRKDIEKTTAKLTPEQWNWKQAPERWSVAECVEHIAASEDFLMDIVANQVMKSPARTEPVNLKEQDDALLARITDRSQKAQAPEPLKPTNRFSTPQESLKHFAASREKNIQFAKKAADLRDHAMAFGGGNQKLDGYQWILFITAHSERHTKQLKEVMADPNFPKK